MLADELGHRGPVGSEHVDGPDVVGAHQAAVLFHIGAQNRGEAPVDVRDRAIVRTAHCSVLTIMEVHHQKPFRRLARYWTVRQRHRALTTLKPVSPDLYALVA